VKFLDLEPIAQVQGTVKMPGSKSISNRVLLLAALSRGETRVKDLLDAEDTRVMLDALVRLGVRIERHADDSAVVHGVGGDFFPSNRPSFAWATPALRSDPSPRCSP